MPDWHNITREQYRDAVKSGLDVAWRCLYCAPIPIAESTAVGDEDMGVTMDSFEIPDSLEMENLLLLLLTGSSTSSRTFVSIGRFHLQVHQKNNGTSLPAGGEHRTHLPTTESSGNDASSTTACSLSMWQKHGFSLPCGLLPVCLSLWFLSERTMI